MKRIIQCLVAALVLIAWLADSAASNIVVWSESALVKVGPTEPPQRTSTGVFISAARNEYEPFQLIIRADGNPLKGVDVQIGDFLSDGRQRLSCRANCTIYRELYIKVFHPSGPYGSTGEWPDALIPKVDRYFDETRNAFPFDLEQDRNQPVWVDVYIPPGTAPGDYRAQVIVRAQGQEAIRIPVDLKVWAFTLPGTSSIRNSFALYPTALPLAHGAFFRGETLDELVRTYSKALLAHRLSNGALLGNDDWLPTQLSNPSAGSLANLRAEWGPFFDGSILPSRGRLTSIIPTHPLCLGGTLCRQDVIDLFASAGWLERMFFYLPDEPNLADPSVVQQVKSIADAIHQVDGRLRTMLSKSYSEVVQPQIDIWLVPLPSLQEAFETGAYWSTYAQEIAKGKEVWVYQACFLHDPACGSSVWFPGSSGWPDYMIDMQGMKNRVQDWVNWILRVQGELYWGVNYRYYEADPYHDQFSYGGNGEGNFLYPGTPERIGGRTHIPIESIRLKLKREGLEDYEYLALLARNGDSAFADRKALEIAPSATNWVTDADTLYRVRGELAARIETTMQLDTEITRDKKPW